MITLESHNLFLHISYLSIQYIYLDRYQAMFNTVTPWNEGKGVSHISIKFSKIKVMQIFTRKFIVLKH